MISNFIRYKPIYKHFEQFSNKKGKVLDFGCGKGELVFYLRQKGWPAYGIDFKLSSAAGKNDYNQFLFSSLSILQANVKTTFQVIILNFSLEHCENPLSKLQELFSLLSNEGFIFIRVPNFDYIKNNKKLGSFQLNIPSHNYFFTLNSLSKLLEKSGFTPILLNTSLCVTSLLTPACSIFPWLDPMDWFYNKTTLTKINKTIILAVFCLLFFPYVLFCSYMNRGPIIFAIAKK